MPASQNTHTTRNRDTFTANPSSSETGRYSEIYSQQLREIMKRLLPLQDDTLKQASDEATLGVLMNKSKSLEEYENGDLQAFGKGNPGSMLRKRSSDRLAVNRLGWWDKSIDGIKFSLPLTGLAIEQANTIATLTEDNETLHTELANTTTGLQERIESLRKENDALRARVEASEVGWELLSESQTGVNKD